MFKQLRDTQRLDFEGFPEISYVFLIKPDNSINQQSFHLDDKILTPFYNILNKRGPFKTTGYTKFTNNEFIQEYERIDTYKLFKNTTFEFEDEEAIYAISKIKRFDYEYQIIKNELKIQDYNKQSPKETIKLMHDLLQIPNVKINKSSKKSSKIIEHILLKDNLDEKYFFEL